MFLQESLRDCACAGRSIDKTEKVIEDLGAVSDRHTECAERRQSALDKTGPHDTSDKFLRLLVPIASAESCPSKMQ